MEIPDNILTGKSKASQEIKLNEKDSKAIHIDSSLVPIAANSATINGNG